MDEVDMEEQALINSSNPSEEFSQVGNEVNKKRKLLCELNDSELPVSKHKFRFRDGLNSFNHESAAKEVTQHGEKYPRGKEIMRDGPEEEESDRDSIISIEDYDSALQANFKGSTEKLSGRLVFPDRPSTSSNSSTDNASGSSITSFDSDNSAVVNTMAENGRLVNDFQFGPEYKDMTALLQGFEEFDDDITSEILRNGMECSDAEILSNAFVLPSGQWSLGQEARLGAQKLTIDQEFEQYFSTLML